MDRSPFPQLLLINHFLSKVEGETAGHYSFSLAGGHQLSATTAKCCPPPFVSLSLSMSSFRS